MVHKVVYLALCPLFMVLGVAKIGSSSSSVSSVRVALGTVHGPAAAVGEGAAGAAGAANGEPGEPGTFLGGQQEHTVPGDGPAAAFFERAGLPPPTLPERKGSRGKAGEGDKDLIPSLLRAVGAWEASAFFRCRHGPQGARLHARRISPAQ